MKNTYLSFLFFLCCFILQSQEKEGIPPSPSVASLVTVEKDSVNNSGTIVQKVSLWDIKLGEYSFPIDLIYSSSGIKVEEIPSYVGTGWNLSSGGVITRSVIDLPDDLIDSDHGKGILHTNLMTEIKNFEYNTTTYGYNEADAKNFIKTKVNENLIEGTRNDTQPDLFYFNFFGKQGKFIFNNNKEIINLSNENYKFSYELASDNTLLSFEIIDESGIVFNFAEREFSETTNAGNTAWEFLISRSLRKRELNYYSAWHLKSISLPNNRIINFLYDDETIKYTIRGAVMGKICGTEQCEDSNETNTDNRDVLNQTEGTLTEYIINSKKIKQIFSENVFDIYFSNTQREDLEGGLKLSNISVKNSNNIEINNFEFHYSYFISTNMPSSDSYEFKRLKLNKISRNNQFLNEFQYYENHSLPNRKSEEQDFWGYYNNNNATSLVPKIFMENINQPYKYHIFEPLNSNYSTYGGINRNVNENYIHMGMLKKMTYQTNGHKEFFYEPNDFNHSLYTNSNTPSIKGNGVRLDKIEYFDGTNVETLNYEYKNPDTNVSSGKLSHLPQFASHIPWNFVYDVVTDYFTVTSPHSVYTGRREYYYDNNTHTYVNCLRYHGGESLNYTPTFEKEKYFAMTTRRYSISQLPLSHNVENALSYEYVTLKEESNGKKIYKFDILGALGDNLPSSYDESKFKNRISYKTYNWYTDDTTPWQTGQCYSNQVQPMGPWTLSVVNQYDSHVDLTGNSHPFSPSANWNRYFGSLKEFIYYNEAGFKVYKENYEYQITGGFHNSTHNNGSIVPEKIISLKHRLFSRPWGRGWSFDSNSVGAITQPTIWLWSFVDTYYSIGLSPKKVIKNYYYENEIQNIETNINYTYNWGNLLTSESTSESGGERLNTHYLYPISFANNNNTYERMVNKNIIKSISSFNYRQDNAWSPKKIISANLFEFTDENGIIKPLNKFELERKDFSFNYSWAYQPNSHHSTINKDQNLKEKVNYSKYDNFGNLLEYRKKNGMSNVLIWGYHKTLPIAKIENINYSQILTYISNLQNKSNNDNDRTIDIINSNGDITSIGSEGALRKALNDLRNIFPNTQITSFTYDPLIGVTSITDPRNETVYYHYDNFNRLEFVKDAKGKILSKNEYNYKN